MIDCNGLGNSRHANDETINRVQIKIKLFIIQSVLSRIYTGDFFAARFEDFLCVKISLAEWLLTRSETRLPRSRFGRIAAV